MKTRWSIAGLALILLLGIAAGWLLFGAPNTVTLTRDDLQREVEKHFPIEHKELLLTGTLSEPDVSLDPTTDRIGLGVTVTIEAPVIKPLKGKGSLEGNVRFDAETRELFLESPVLRLIEAEGISDKDLRSAESLVRPILSEAFRRVPIYRLKESDLRIPITSARLKDLRVDEGRVVMRFSR